MVVESVEKKSLAGLVGVAAACLLLVSVAGHEGEVLKTYYDPVGIATVCYGDTDPAFAVPGKTYTSAECLQSLERQLVAHAAPVIMCLPGIKAAPPEMTAAFVSLAYNIGANAFCKSTVAKRFRAGDYAGSCEAIELFTKAKGKVMPGLVVRRKDERILCEQGVKALIHKKEGNAP